jgi:hypothetical protein
MYNVIFEQMFKRSVDNLRLFVGEAQEALGCTFGAVPFPLLHLRRRITSVFRHG